MKGSHICRYVVGQVGGQKTGSWKRTTKRARKVNKEDFHLPCLVSAFPAEHKSGRNLKEGKERLWNSRQGPSRMPDAMLLMLCGLQNAAIALISFIPRE